MQCEGTNKDGTSCRKMVTYSGWNTGSDGGLYCHQHRQNLGFSLSTLSSRLRSTRSTSYCIGRRSMGVQCKNITTGNKFCRECRYQKLIPEKYRKDYFGEGGAISEKRVTQDRNGEKEDGEDYIFIEDNEKYDVEVFKGMKIFIPADLIWKGKFVKNKFVYGTAYFLTSGSSNERKFDLNGNGQGIERDDEFDGHSSVFEGEYVNEKKHGKGNFRNTNGDFKEGEWKEGNFWSGRVGYNYKILSLWFDSEHRTFFVSEWRYGKPWSGIANTLEHNVHFSGEFKSGKKNGNGVFLLDEISVVGLWNDDIFVRGELMIEENYDIVETIVNIPEEIKEKLSNDFDENTCQYIQKYFGKTGYQF